MTGGAAGRRGVVNPSTNPTDIDPYNDDCADFDDRPPHTIPIQDIEEWADYWSEDLAILYHVLQDQASSMGLPMLEKCTFSDFVEFAYAHSSRFPPKC